MSQWTPFGAGTPPAWAEEPAAVPPAWAQPVRPPSPNRRRTIAIVLGVIAAVIAVLVAIGLLANVDAKQKGVRSEHPQTHNAALALLDTIPIKGRAPKTGYSRAQFGKAWTDDVDVEGGHNNCDTRSDILRRDLSDVVTDDDCRVLSGVLHDPYTGKDVPFDREEGTDVLVQIDHIVPLLNAWETGAQGWDQSTRVQFANDPSNLLAVSGKANRTKRAGDVATWLPRNKNFRCEYVTKVVGVKAKYGLWMTPAEHAKASEILTGCASVSLPSSVRLPSTGVLYPPPSLVSTLPN